MRFTYEPIGSNEARGVSRVNALLNDFASASDDVDHENFAEEGLDKRAVQVHPVESVEGVVTETDRDNTPLPTGGSYQTLVFSGTTFNISGIGALAAGESLRIRSRLWCETTLNNGQGITNELLTQLWWSNGAVFAAVLYSRRLIRKQSGGDAGYHGSLYTNGWLHGPIANVSQIELRYQTNNTVHASKCQLWVVRRKSVVAI